MEKHPQHIIKLVTSYRDMTNNIQQTLIVAIFMETGRLGVTIINFINFTIDWDFNNLCILLLSINN